MPRSLTSTKTCNAAQIDGPLRCELLKGHTGDHTNMNDEAVPISWPNHRDARTARLVSRRRPQKETYHHELADAFTDGIKADRISNQLLVHGLAFCLDCGAPLCAALSHLPVDLSSSADFVRFELALDDAMKNSAKHHDNRRRDHGYRPNKYGNDFGHDTPVLIKAPICHDCHTGANSKRHPGPQFGQAKEVSL